MPLPSGLKIEPAKVILFLKLKLTDFVVFYSPPLEGCPPRRAGWILIGTFLNASCLTTKLQNNILLQLIHHIIQIMFDPKIRYSVYF